MSYYKIQNFEQYFKHYNKSVREPRKFWGKIEEILLGTNYGIKLLNSIWLKQKLSGLPKQNIAKNCIDRHLNKEVIKQP
jgi:acetyl-CoA synthetase